MYDVIIIGAGPAGTTCGKIIGSEGFSVKIYDRREEIGSPKRCGEGLDKKAEDLIGKIPERCIANVVHGARVYSPDGNFVEIPGEGYILERKVFDKWLAEVAAKYAEIQSSTLIKDIERKEDGMEVIGEFCGEEFKEKAKIVIVATGAESKIARKFVNNTCKLNLVDTCLQYEMTGVNFDEKLIHIFFGNEVARRGYVWVFPKGNGRANVGVGVIPHEKSPKHYLEKFIKEKKEEKKIDGSIIEVNAGIVPVGGILEDCVSDNLIVCGEAAHHVNPIHGGGIKEAIVSGKIAGEIAVKCLKKGKYSKKELSEFNKIWMKERGKKLKLVEKAREVMEKLKDEDFNELVKILTPKDIINIADGNLLSIIKLLIKNRKFIKYAMMLK